MEASEKFKILAEQMHLEPAEETQPATLQPLPCEVNSGPKDTFIHAAVLPNGQRLRMLKTMLTSACERNCYYCPFRAGRNYRRVTFQPEELANTFMQMHRAGAVDGMFLSSGVIRGGVRTQDRLLATAEILRRKHKYRGYLHMKVMPGAEYAQVREAMQLADRLSVNLEAPNTERLQSLAPRKQFLEELLRPLRWIEAIRQNQPGHLGWNGRWPSSVTQFVVGGGDEASDLEFLSTTDYLYRNLRLARSYFSGFRPIEGTPLENLRAEDPLRQHRLYQASFLLRDYEFELEELPFGGNGRLPLGSDPKLAWAEVNLQDTPVELNRASRRELLRVPGIGRVGAERILVARRKGVLRSLGDLKKLGLHVERGVPFILLDGRRPARQLGLW